MDEGQPAVPRPGWAAQPPRAEDRELGRRRPGQQVAGGDRVLELGRVKPFPVLDAQPAQQRDVGRGPAEPDDPDPPPLAQHRAQPGQPGPRRYPVTVIRRLRHTNHYSERSVVRALVPGAGAAAGRPPRLPARPPPRSPPPGRPPPPRRSPSPVPLP